MRRFAAAVTLIALWAASARAQFRSTLQLGARGVLSGTQTDAIAGGGTRREFRLEQSMLTASALTLSGRLQLTGSLSIDRAFSDDGVLALGGWGGGLYDRQHPHDYLMEAVASFGGEVGTGPVRPGVSLTGGKGFVPFGPDHPMDRPVLRAPINHDWSQIMERWFGSFAIRGNRAAFEAAVFNGGGHAHTADPEHPTGHEGHGGCTSCDATPSTTSGSARITVWPRPWMELRLSGAALRSPAHHAGAVGTHQMLNLNVSSRHETRAGFLSGLVEFSNVQIEETYRSILAEAELARSRVRAYYRFERADRAEGARSTLFRAAPELQPDAVGITRWLVNTIGAGIPLRVSSVTLEPLAEFGIARVSSVGDAPIDVRSLYQNRVLWSGIIAVRTMIGTHRAMGQYGIMTRRIEHVH